MTENSEEGVEAVKFPESFNDYVKFAAAETNIAEEKLRFALERFPPSRADLINIIWHQARQNFAMLEMIVALVTDERQNVVASADSLVKIMRDGFEAMAGVSAELTKAGMQDADATRGDGSGE